MCKELPDDPLKADTYYGAEKLEEEQEDEGGDYEGEEEEEVDAQGATVVRVPRRAADGTILSTSGAATLQGVRDQMQRALALESSVHQMKISLKLFITWTLLYELWVTFLILIVF